MPTKVEAFKCDYCGRILKLHRTAAVHESSCKNNPTKRHCITCVHGITACYGIAPDWSDPYGPGTEVYGPYCGYHAKPISEKPYLIECDTYGWFDPYHGWYKESPIPYTCHHHESKGKAEWTPEEQYNGGQENE